MGNNQEDNQEEKKEPIEKRLDERKSEEFVEIFQKGKQFTKELLEENEKLRYRIASLKSKLKESDTAGEESEEITRLRRRVKELEEEKKELEEKYREVEEENEDFAQRYVEIEEQNNNLANLYVASYQLHSTLDFQEVIQIVLEIVINLVGAEEFGIKLLDEETNELSVVAHENMEDYEKEPIKVGDGVIGEVAKTGEPYYMDEDEDREEVDYFHPRACIPLKIKEHVIGVISIYSLLTQKESFSTVDYELFTMLAGHAATAIYSSKLYSQSERKLDTIQSFLDLLTRTPSEGTEEST